MSDHDVDVAVIGAGPGGYVSAIRAAQKGLETAIVEPEMIGGVCLHRGCIPSKALIHAAGLADSTRHLDDLGIEVGEVSVDVGKLQSWKGRVTKRLVGGVGQLLDQNGVTHVEGRAAFEDSRTLTVEGEDAGTVTADHVVVATGSSPIELPFLPFDEDRVLSSTGALEMTEAPEELLIVGGGYIGLELGTVYRKLGSQVTVVEMMDQLLPGTDPELVEVLAKQVQKLGISTHLESKVAGAEVTDDGVELTVETPDGKQQMTGDRVLVTVGRRPTPPPGLEDNTDATLDEDGFVEVDVQRRTRDEAVYAIGDVAGEPMLAHKASREGIVAAEAIAGEPAAFDNRAVPAVVFTDPEIAYVGLTAEEAKQAGKKVRVGRFPMAASGRALTTDATEGFVKVVADDAGTVVGAQIVAAHASDLIAEAALAIEMGATLEDLAATIHAHPTLPETLMEAAEDARGEAIHIYRA